MRADPLLQPYAFKHLTLRNRIISTGHEPAYTEDGLPKKRYRLYHAEKAKGGIGLTMIGGSASVAPDSPQAFGNILLYKDEAVKWLSELADDVHENGAAVMTQITHLGRRTFWSRGDWYPILAPSSIKEGAHRSSPKAMEDWDIERVISDYADGAERAKAAGLDGIEIVAYSHLMDQFWSPLTNHRDDEYGGSLENRMRFSNRVIAAVRDRVGPDYIVGLRMVCDEQLENGIDKTEGLEIAHRFATGGQIDFINVIRGHIDTEEGISHVIPGMGAPSSPHLDFAGEVREHTRVTVMHASRIQDVATARHAIESGKLDLVGMTRAHMADPHLVEKIMNGTEDRIRPCVGMGYCIDSIYGGEAACIHNPATGREEALPHEITETAATSKKIVVVGGGPAGLEAARVAAARGHQVILFEAGPEPGGQVRLSANVRRRAEILGIVDWRIAECERLGVEIRCNVWAEDEEILAEEPDVVVIATGGLPNTSFLKEGEDLATTSWDVLAGSVKPAGEVVLFDDSAGHAGMSTAEYLAKAGSKLEIVTPERTLGPDVGGTSFPPYFKIFSDHDVRVTHNLRLTGVKRNGNRLVGVFYDEYGHREIERECDQIVVENGTLPLDDVYFSLKAGSSNLGEIDYRALSNGAPQALTRNPDGRYQLLRIGDAVAGRNIHAAVFDAMRLMKDI